MDKPIQTNLSGLGEALGFSRQMANKLSKLPGFPYLQKPGEHGASRWLVDVGQVRRWLEARETERAEDWAAQRERWKLEQAFRDFWNQLLHRGYRPDEISAIRDRCFGIVDLQKAAQRYGITLNV